MPSQPDGRTTVAVSTALGWMGHYADVQFMPMQGFKSLFLVGITVKGLAQSEGFEDGEAFVG